MTAATITGSQAVFWRPSVPAAPPLRIAHGLRSDRRLAATVLAAICAFALLLTAIAGVSTLNLLGTESGVAAQTDPASIGVGFGGSETPTTVGENGPWTYDGSLGYCVGSQSPAPGSLRTVGSDFSASEQRVAQLLADGGDTVVLREATGVGRTSDLLVNGVPYDVYTPTTGNIDRIVSAVSSKGSQVQGGGVIIDLADSPLTTAQLGDILPRVQGVTSQISDIRVVGG